MDRDQSRTCARLLLGIECVSAHAHRVVEADVEAEGDVGDLEAAFDAPARERFQVRARASELTVNVIPECECECWP